MIATKPTPRQVIQSPELYARYFLRIQTKAGGIVPFRYNRIQQLYAASMTRRDLVVKPRQVGMSTLLSGENVRRVTTDAIHSLTLADKAENTHKLRRIFKRFFDNWPDGIPAPLRGEDSAIITTFPEMNSSASIATAGSGTAGRAGTYQFFHGSEAAYWPDPETVISGALQSIPNYGYAVLESTANGAQGYFYELVMESLDGSNDWQVHFYPWWFEPEYAIKPDEPMRYTADELELVERHSLTPAQINWRRVKHRELKHLFQQEYPENIHDCFLHSGIGYFGDIAGALHDGNIERQESHRYVAGLDFGQANDYTVLSIGNVDSGQQVDILRMRRLPWQDMLRRILDKCQEWRVHFLLPESNSIGAVNIEYLRDHAYDGLTVGYFTTTAKTKPGLISGLHAAIHSGALSLMNTPELRNEFRGFTASQTASGHWKYEAAPGSHDDIVIATALMWRAMNRPDATFIEFS